MHLKKLLFAMVCIAWISLPTYAQNRTVSGKVTDSKTGASVYGASVQIKGTRIGTSTNAEGAYTISNVPANATVLVVTSIGYETQEVSIANNLSSADVSLIPSSTDLGEVVVSTGYGTSRKKDLTGSVASVREKDFNKGVFTSPDQLIQGKVSGLQVINNSGQPGGAATIRIRGAGSVRGGNAPLFVIDGVPLEGGTARPGLGLPNVGGSPSGNPLNFINPNDIASIDVLKDASAAAIYGARGANGVIIITTKKAQGGAPTIDFGYSIGSSRIAKKLEVLSGNEYRSTLTKYGLTTGDYGSSVNAMNEILQTGVTHNVNISASGGNENSRYRFSASFLDEKGIIKESKLKKYTVGFTGNFKFLDSKKLGLDVTLNTAQVDEDIIPVTNDAGFEGNLIGQALQWNPTHDLIKSDGTYWIQPQFGASSINPLWFLKMYDDNVLTSTIFGSISPYYKISKSLEYRFLYSLNQNEGDRKAMVGRQLLNIDRYKDRGYAAVSNNRIRTQQYTHTLSYNGQLSSAVSLNAVGGFEYTKFQFNFRSITAQDFDDIGIPYYNMLGFSTVASRAVSNFEGITNELQSYFLRTAFNIMNKYLFTATIRADGSSKFGENNKYGYFPAFSAAWNISNEDFMRTVNFVSNLKLRASWGQTGNQEFPSGAAITRFGVSGPGAISQINVANPDLKWETSTTFNIGLDFGLLRNRVNVVIDYFNKETDDVLFERDFPQPGASSAKQWINSPVYINNKGVEIAVNAVVVRNNDLTWNFGVNTAFLKNRLEGLVGTYNTGALHGQGSTGAYVQKLASGYPLNTYYLRIFQGIDKTTGQAIYEADGDVSFYVNKSPNPTFLLGISTDVQYKKWSLAVNMNGAYGHYLYNNTAQSVVPITNLGTRNVASSLVSASVVENTSNPITSSTRFLEKGDYLKLANATLSYNVGGFAKFIRNCTLSLTAQNLFVLTDFTGYDPEVNVDKNIGGIPSLGIEYIPYPTSRRFQFSMNFGF